MGESFEFTGVREFNSAVERLVNSTNARTPQALRDVAATAAALMRSNASHGSHAKGTPTPATPGSGPAMITGNLVRNIAFTESRTGEFSHESRVGVRPGAPEAIFLERGARGVRYPFIKPALERARLLLAAALRREWSRH